MDVRALHEIPWERDTTCGRLRVLYKSPQESCSLVYFEIESPTIPHFHEKMTEVYLIKRGRGRLRIHDINAKTPVEERVIEEGQRVVIPVKAVHQITPIDSILGMEVLSDPKFDPRDIYEVPGYFERR